MTPIEYIFSCIVILPMTFLRRLRDFKRTIMVLLISTSARQLRLAENRTGFLLIPMAASRSWPASMVRRNLYSTRRGSCWTLRKRTRDRQIKVVEKVKIQKQLTAETTSMATDVSPSPHWSRAMPPGPDRLVKITIEYAKHVAADAFFWAWPLVNIYNKRLGAEKSKELTYAGPVPAAPLNRIVMLTDYVAPDERIVACPNQDR
jgi:hypothetical protein